MRSRKFRCLLAALALTCGACGPSADAPRDDALDTLISSELTTTHLADRSCQVVLREAALARRDDGALETACTGSTCEGVVVGTLELSAQAAASGRPYVTHQSAEHGRWYTTAATQVKRTPSGGALYRFRIRKNTLKVTANGQLPAQARLELGVYVRGSDGSRLYDHNRVPGDFDNYVLDATSGFAVSDDPRVCPAQPLAHAQVQFRGDGQTLQRGRFVAGGDVTLDYALTRLTRCRGTHNGFPAWDLRAFIRFSPGGQQVDGTVRAFETHNGVPTPVAYAAPFTFRVPADAQRAEVWFKNSAGNGCEAYDSNFGLNHAFTVWADPPPPVAWAGDFGGSFSRSCVHSDGVPEVQWVDSYIQQRACMFVDVDVYAPGVTDRVAAPEAVLAQVAWRLDGQAERRDWLTFVERVGNNYRFRWDVPRQELNLSPWNTLFYQMRLSTNGVAWKTVGASNGAPRRIEREESWCGPGWATCARP